MRIIDQIRNRESFTPTENTLAKYLEENSRQVVNMSLEQLANTLYVSKSSIIRFCKKLGFKGHKELCVKLAKEMDTFVYDSELVNPSNPYRENDTMDRIAGKTYQLCHGALYDTYNDLELDEISLLAKKIAETEKVYLYVLEETGLCGEYFSQSLQKIGIEVHISNYPGSMIENACRQTVDSTAVILSYGMFNQEMRRAAEILHEAGVPAFLISGLEKNPINSYVDHQIRIRYFEPSPKVNCIGSKMAILLVLDVIYGEIFRQNYDRNLTMIKDYEKRRTNH
ncbi:MAG: MurR/RpiR family transcriptional regulator [Erysipelotrichaceae bacterium]|nr:MurR/RpiR family transcriptional regulator [Erysipelotrichaceae bacterium]MDY4809505.1 MurR/RpiR family transcriptional regulator [Bulleidia sp.]